MLETLLERFGRKDRLALSRLLSFLSRGQHVSDILSRLPPRAQLSLVVAITGSAGVGKSSLIGRLLETIRAAGRTVAVLACDPQSPLSGGALLGDRFRMPSRPEDAGVFIRSLAAAGGHGALAEHVDTMLQLLDAFGFDVVLLETVGAGQGDTAVRDLADVVVVLLQPETGDDLQWEKAGVLEVADVLVLHKADLPGADQVEAQVRSMLALGNRVVPPVVRVSSRTGNGVEELWQTISRCTRHREQKPAGSGEELLHLAQQKLAEQFFARQSDPSADPELAALLASWRSGNVKTEEAIARLCEQLLRGER